MTGSVEPVLDIQNLSVSYRHRAGLWQPVVHDVSFQIQPGQVLALVGESGSGKSTTAHAVIGLLAGNARIDTGRIHLAGELLTGSERQYQSVRGNVVSLIPQDPVSSLNPVQTIGDQVGEVLRLHRRLTRKERTQRVLDALDRVGISRPALRARQYPHELSGGMRQRVLIAIALALKPALIIADEPTSALDVTVQRRILDLIDELRRESNTAVLMVTHDLAVASDRSDQIVVLQNGRIQESGPTSDILSAPQSAYTRRLLHDAPSFAFEPGYPPQRAASVELASTPAVEVRSLRHAFRGSRRDRAFQALNDVSFTVPSGRTHALVGESGSGKTTSIRAVMGLLRPDAGDVQIEGQCLKGIRGEDLRQLRRKIQLVYQNPFSSLDPHQTVFQIIEEPLLNFEKIPSAERKARVEQMLARVGLLPNLLERTPAALSGGQRQRVAIARALILNPRILVLDEAVSALDVTVQAQILTLLQELQQTLGLSYLFISHDLAVIRRIADTVTVLREGQVVEQGLVEEVFQNPQHPYTQELINAIPGRKQHHHA